MQKRLKPIVLFVSLAGALLLSAGCSKKTAKVTPPNPPAPTAPTATLAANPSVIQQGQSTILSWQTNNASDISVAGLGTLPSSGSRTVVPSSSTADASARVTVNAAVSNAASSLSDEDLFSKNMKDIFFDYNKADVRPGEVPTTYSNSTFLSQHPNVKVVIEGHCDDRGSEEYNLALGTSRAESVKQALVQEGISAERITTVSLGKEKPFCSQDNERCWQQNRVDHFVFAR
jgi:peptidoglycan-associated lipoprotein